MLGKNTKFYSLILIVIDTLILLGAFSLAYVARVQYDPRPLYPNYRKMFIRVGIAGALVVFIFALLQVFVLPYDFLTYLGYNKNTIVPYLVVDKNYAFIRINSTLRGPNPLGAYSVVILSLVVSAVMRHKIKRHKWPLAIFTVISVGGLVALWVSYSRSALVAMLVSVGIIFGVCKLKNLSKKGWTIIATVLLVMSAGLFMIRGTSFVSNVLLHDNPSSDSNYSSNQGHADSLKHGTDQLIHQPLGAGIGSTGSASMLGSHAETIENQYLFIAHEVGWLGLGLFLFIFASILTRLWKLRSDWFALGVFASGIGLALICLLLPILVDDTVAIIWWGLAAIALFPAKGDL